MQQKNNFEIHKCFDDLVREKYDELNLKHLKQVDDNLDLVGTLREKKIANAFDYSEFKLLDELDYLTQELKYQTSMLHIFANGINNPNEENNTYIQTVYDHRYLMYSNWSLQTVYNYWDRLGDLLWHTFETNISIKNVYFKVVFDAIPVQYKDSPHYKHIRDIYEKKVINLIQNRHDSVHHYSLETIHRWTHIQNSDFTTNAEMYETKKELAIILKEQLSICLEIFNEVVNLINELPNKKTTKI